MKSAAVSAGGTGAVTCPSCGSESNPGAHFCSHCGATLEQDAVFAARERKVVTVLFCDLVGFTALSEQADPEDVDRVLRDYAQVTRHATEIHGGIVEKFIGDAVVAVFGVPAAHEDDAERAVRAALRIRQDLPQVLALDGHPVRIRIGVNTGEALVHLDASMKSGKGFLAGDAVNVAARLQQAAPPDCILVGPTTYALSSRRFRYEELEPIPLKGRTEPTPVWLVDGAISRTGLDLATDFATRFVGRECELAQLQDSLEAAIDEHCAKVVLVTGEPGIGKSRLVTQFAHLLDELPRKVTWRQGRCLPYGEGVGFSVLGEIVKAQAGILETDGAEAIERKLRGALLPSPEIEWLLARLRPLVGLESPAASREENFAAWTHFISQIASVRPMVLVLEDLHWADDAMLAFVQQLATELPRLSLLVMLTARSHLLDDKPGFASTIIGSGVHAPLSELSAGQAQDLLKELLGGSASVAGLGDSIMARCGGNPFYMEELVRLLKERGLLLVGPDGVRLRDGAAEQLPESVRAAIAARLDALDGRHRALLSDAAVVGQSFSAEAVQALAQNAEPAVEGLTQLATFGLIRAAGPGHGQDEFAFRHALTRDVAYKRLTRHDRAVKHRLFAEWLEAASKEGAVQPVELLAHHYKTALDLFARLQEQQQAHDLIEPSCWFLLLAGNRVLPVDPADGVRYLGDALTLSVREDRIWAPLMLSHARALRYLGRLFEAESNLLELLSHSTESGDGVMASSAMVELAETYWELGDARAEEYSKRALVLSASHPPSSGLCEVLEQWVKNCIVNGEWQEVVQVADRTLEMSRRVGMKERWRALHYRGAARCALGDMNGLDDCSLAVDLAMAQGLGHELAGLQVNTAADLFTSAGPRSALDQLKEGLDTAALRRDGVAVLLLRTAIMQERMWAGLWEESLAEAEALDSILDEREQVLELQCVRTHRSLLLTLRGRADEGLELAKWAEASSRPFMLNHLDCLAPLAAAYMALGQRRKAADVLEILAETDSKLRFSDVFSRALPTAIRTAIAGRDYSLVSKLAAVPGNRPFDSHVYVWLKALLAEHEGSPEAAVTLYAEAAVRWRDFGVPYEEAQSSWGEGRCLSQLGKLTEATTRLQSAHDIFARLDAKPDRTEICRLIASLSAGACE
jgi:class 3 adenylate cyclase/tetratricopeptide (TPR) repeat protein